MRKANKKMRKANKNMRSANKNMSRAYKNFYSRTLSEKFFKKNFQKLEYTAAFLGIKSNMLYFLGFAYFFNLFYVNLFAKSQ